MVKTFVVTPAAGAVAALMGWFGTLLIKEFMGPAEFATLRFGWSGTMIAATAAAIIVLLLLARDLVEPLVMTVVAAGGLAVLWDRTEMPFDTSRFNNGTSTAYWLTVTIMAVTFLLLLLGLRAARESTNSYRSSRR